MKPLTDEEIAEEAKAFGSVIVAGATLSQLAAFGRLCRDGRPQTFEEARNRDYQTFTDYAMKPLSPHDGHTRGADFGRQWEREHGQRVMPTQEEIDAWLLHKTQDCLEDWERGFRSGARDILLWLAERDKPPIVTLTKTITQKGE